MDWRPIYESIIGLSFLCLLFSIEMGRRVHWCVGLALFILLITGLRAFFFPAPFPIPTDPFLVERGAGEIFYSLVTILLFSSCLLLKPRNFFKALLNCVFLCALLDSLVLIYSAVVLKQPRPYAMLNNGTADATFIVCLLPMAFEMAFVKKSLDGVLTMIVMVGGVQTTKSNTAFAGIGVACAAWLLTKYDFKMWIARIIPIICLLGLAAWSHLGDHFLVDSGRFRVWQGSWDFYCQFANLWTGFGTGTFTAWGVAAQKTGHLADKDPYVIWVWLHNEPLEILFENGVLGLITALTVYFFILKKTFKKSIAFPIACVYGFIGLTEMPLRLWVTQILGMCLLSEAFKLQPQIEINK